MKYLFLDLKKEIKRLQNQLSNCERQKLNLREKVRDLEYASVISKDKRARAGKFNVCFCANLKEKQTKLSKQKKLPLLTP